MVNKKRIGEYLKNLRLQKIKSDGKRFTQNDLASELISNYNCDISINAIAGWEKGNSLPSPENLKNLAEIYNKTVDEILDAADKSTKNYVDIYFLSKPNMGFETITKNDNIFQIANEQIKLITQRFKELVLIRIDRYFTMNEEAEFRFLFEHFYLASNYAYEISQLNVSNDYLIFKYAMQKTFVKIKNLKKEEQYWELQKLYSEQNKIWFTFWANVSDLEQIPIIQERFENIEDWQKDMLLAMFQTIEPYSYDPSRFGSKLYQEYEENNGEYNKEKIYKSMIKELINRGACINQYFLSAKKSDPETKRIIDRLEELYNLCLKPIEIQTMVNGKIKTFKIENNVKNRFLKDCYYTLRNQINGFNKTDNEHSNIDDIYNLFKNNEQIPEEIYLKIAKQYNIDTNKKRKYWMVDVQWESHIDDYFYKFKEKEKQIELGLEEIKKLKKKLENGEKTYIVHKYQICGGNDEETIRDWIEYWKKDLNYSEFLEERNKELTNELLNEIDDLSIDEIRNKYFKMEVIEENE